MKCKKTSPSNDFLITLTGQPLREDIEAIRQAIKIFNDWHSEHHRKLRQSGKEPLVVLIRSEEDELFGGLVGATYWNWLYIDELWVEERYRRQGLGKELMRRAETEARNRRCRKAHVRTWDFQAKEFYARLGYTVAGRLSDYPPGQTFYWLQKELMGFGARNEEV